MTNAIFALMLFFGANGDEFIQSVFFDRSAGPEIISAFRVELDAALLEGDVTSFRLSLPEGTTEVVHRVSSQHNLNGTTSWQGIWTVNHVAAPVILTTKNGCVSGLIYLSNRVVQIRPTIDGNILEELDHNSFDGCETDESGFQPAKVNPLPNNIHSVELDVLIVYTPDAEQAVGGSDGMDVLVQNAMDITNYAFLKSQIDARVRLVHARSINYPETGNLEDDLNWLKNDPACRSMRAEVGADFVGLIVENAGNSCGRAFVQRSTTVPFSESAFQVTARSCTVGNLSFTHELAHNLGCEHNPESSDAYPNRGSYPWSFGHYVNGVFRTVMSYSAACTNGCPRIPLFSNAAILVDGFPAGIPNQRENYRVINQTSPSAAKFRQSTK
ncbi:MAG: hypothetical protein KDC35_03885 [Acidobacteria bacterium]|nr:hypothetical protein [Acidobacteriota bacterium]